MRCFAVSVGAVHSDSTVSVVGFEDQSNRWWVSWDEWLQSLQWLRALGSILFMYWQTIWLWPVRSCASIVGRPLRSFDKLLSMAVLIASWWILLIAVLLLVLLSGSSARYCWILGLSRPIRERRRSGRSSGGLWQSWWQGCCGRWHAMENCWEISSLCWSE